MQQLCIQSLAASILTAAENGRYRTKIHAHSDLDELWIGRWCMSFKEFVWLIVSVFTRPYIFIGIKKMSDVGEYVKPSRWRERERGVGGLRRMLLQGVRSRRVIKVALCM